MDVSSASGSGTKKRKRNQKNDEFLHQTFDSIIPNERQENNRKQLIKKLTRLIRKKFRYSEVYVYGSYASRTALYWSDIDIGIKVNTSDAERMIVQVEDILQNNGFSNVEFLSKEFLVSKKIEKVYFVHGRDNNSKIGVDLSLNNTLASFSSSFVRAVADFDISTRVFLILIKQFAKVQGLNNGKAGTLSSIGHSYLGILYLLRSNLCPQFLVKDDISEVGDLVNEAKTYKSISDQFPRPSSVTPVETLIQGYFNYYSKDHNFKNMAISLRGGCSVSKESLGWPANEKGYFLGIIDPFSGENVGSAVTEIGLKKIQLAFRTALQYAANGKFKELFRPFKPFKK